MRKFTRWIGFLAMTGALGAAGCNDMPDEYVETLREPSITITPDETFVPEIGEVGTSAYVPVRNPDDPQGSYLDGTHVLSVPETQVHVRLRATNVSDLDLDMLIINFFIADPRKSFIFKVAGWGFLGAEYFNVPSPAMLDETTPLFESGQNPYPGFVNYVPVRPIAAGETVEFEVMAGAVAGFMMHLEGAAKIIQSQGIWATPVPRSGTTILVTESAGTSARTTVEEAAASIRVRVGDAYLNGEGKPLPRSMVLKNR